MHSDLLKCSLAECKARLCDAHTMSLKELETYATRCSTCGNWILKDNAVANTTYLKITTLWAEKFNEALLERK